MSNYYQELVILPPLDNDPEKNGKPSDHCIVTLSAINVINNKSNRTYKEVTYRPITEDGISKMNDWLEGEYWVQINEKMLTHRQNFLWKLLKQKKMIFSLRKKEEFTVIINLFSQGS